MRLPALVLAALLAFASTADAAPKPQITDKAGDQVAVAGAGYDIVSAAFSTTGTTARVGRKKVYTPTKLVVQVTYAAAVPSDQHATQVVGFDAPGCEGIYLQSFSGGTFGSADCLEDPFDFTAKTAGKTVTFTVPFNVVGKAYLKKGAALTNLSTYTAFAEPVLGYETGQLTGGDPGGVDHAATTAVYRIR